MNKIWKSEVLDFSKIDKDKAAFIFSQGEKELQSTLILSNSIKDDSLKLLASLMTLAIIIGGLLISSFYSSKAENKPVIFITLFIFLILLMFAIYKCKQVISLKQYQFLGNQPKNLWLKDWLNQDIPILMMTESESCQRGIENNRNCNEERSALLGEVINIAFASPIFSFFVWLVLTVFSQIASFNSVCH